MARNTLITGGRGFTGLHLLAHLQQAGFVCQAPSREELDLRDGAAAHQAVRSAQPRYVFHLAGLASVKRSWQEPEVVLQENLAITFNVLEAIRRAAPEAKVLIASSSEVYGPPQRLPIDEDAPLRPQNPYAVSKAACDLLAGQYADAHGLHVVRTRAFNHAGPGQHADYVVSALARQVADAEGEGLAEAVIRTGNPDAARDFTDVRDVARAYAAAIELRPGIYNVCSGKAITVRQLIDLLQQLTPLVVRHEIDPDRIRPTDVREVRGSSELLRRLTGWQPQIAFVDTVRDALNGWRTGPVLSFQ